MLNELKNITLTFSPTQPTAQMRSRQETAWGEDALLGLPHADFLLNKQLEGWVNNGQTNNTRCEIALTWTDGFILIHAAAQNSLHNQPLGELLVCLAALQCTSLSLDEIPVTNDVTFAYIEAANRLGYSTEVNVLLGQWRSDQAS